MKKKRNGHPDANGRGEVFGELSGRRAAIWFRAPAGREAAVEPKIYIDNDAGDRIAAAPISPAGLGEGPSGSIAVAPGRAVLLGTWAGELDLPAIEGPLARAVLADEEPPELRPGERRVPAPPGRYRVRVYSFLDGEPLGEVDFELPAAIIAECVDVGQDDAAFIKSFLTEARAVGEACWMRPGRWGEDDLAEMARAADLDAIPPLQRELLLRVRRLRIADHDLVTPPIIDDDLEEVRVQAGDHELFPWFSLKPYDRGRFVCFDLERGGLAKTENLQLTRLPQSPRAYLLELLRLARER